MMDEFQGSGGIGGVELPPHGPPRNGRVWVRLRAGRGYLLRCGGIRPVPRRRPPGRLRMADRKEISRGLAAGWSIRAIASGVGIRSNDRP
jgi:hypothetical protein